MLDQQYGYDPNGNRTHVALNGGPLALVGEYDDQDRIIAYDGYQYAFDNKGTIRAKSNGIQNTEYAYDEFNNLNSVNLPDGRQLTYLIDGKNRRVGKRVNGNLTQGFLYKDQLHPVAELNAAGQIASLFVYGPNPHVPECMVKEGQTYKFVTNQIGSVRLVVNAATGNVAQRIDYDAFGRVIFDSNPGFQPFGFAGGIYDPDTGLVRFGARDYDAVTGRWTAKDPILFDGGDANLYGYVGGDPVNFIDPTGLCETGIDWGEIIPWMMIAADLLAGGPTGEGIVPAMAIMTGKNAAKSASEKMAKDIGRRIQKDIGRDARREFHDMKESGAPDRTADQLRQDAKDIYQQANKIIPDWLK